MRSCIKSSGKYFRMRRVQGEKNEVYEFILIICKWLINIYIDNKMWRIKLLLLLTYLQVIEDSNADNAKREFTIRNLQEEIKLIGKDN